MSAITLDAGTTQIVYFTPLSCSVCGTHFALSREFMERRRGDGQTFCCPNGHPQCYGESRERQLEREAAKLRAALEGEQVGARHLRVELDTAKRQVAAEKGHFARLKRRACHGVCPACHRTFHQVARHIRTKHPEYVASTK